MKSSEHDLQKRGYAAQSDIEQLQHTPQEQLLELLRCDNAVVRTSAAANLDSVNNQAADALLNRLAVEKCLYTKIAICKSLERGNRDTAEKMTHYLGKIGNNQHRHAPGNVSAKKSFPLPRDIIARALGNMDVAVFPVLLEALRSDEVATVSEALDAVGYMAFYNPSVATLTSAQVIFDVMNRWSDNELLLWKAVLCLSAFPLQESKHMLNKFAHADTVLGREAARSLKLLESRHGKSIIEIWVPVI